MQLNHRVEPFYRFCVPCGMIVRNPHYGESLREFFNLRPQPLNFGGKNLGNIHATVPTPAHVVVFICRPSHFAANDSG
jgi:hypothetical protein